jgi:hypothetical protein
VGQLYCRGVKVRVYACEYQFMAHVRRRTHFHNKWRVLVAHTWTSSARLAPIQPYPLTLLYPQPGMREKCRVSEPKNWSKGIDKVTHTTSCRVHRRTTLSLICRCICQHTYGTRKLGKKKKPSHYHYCHHIRQLGSFLVYAYYITVMVDQQTQAASPLRDPAVSVDRALEAMCRIIACACIP